MSAEYGRDFNEARRKQGFKSQEHLDAFYAAYDHQRGCPVCSTVSGSVWVVDGWQPTLGRCEEARRLDAIQFAF